VLRPRTRDLQVGGDNGVSSGKPGGRREPGPCGCVAAADRREMTRCGVYLAEHREPSWM